MLKVVKVTALYAFGYLSNKNLLFAVPYKIEFPVGSNNNMEQLICFRLIVNIVDVIWRRGLKMIFLNLMEINYSENFINEILLLVLINYINLKNLKNNPALKHVT